MARQSHTNPGSRLTITALVAQVVLATAIAACSGPGGSPAAGSAAPASAGPPANSGAIPAGHPLIGTWTVDVTRADLAAAGLTDPGLQNENSGRFGWTFSPDGTWTQVQQSLDGAPIDNPVFRGTWAVEGATLTATTLFPEQDRDEGLEFTWAVEGEELRVDLLNPPDPVLPVIMETHPWRRGG